MDRNAKKYDDVVKNKKNFVSFRKITCYHSDNNEHENFGLSPCRRKERGCGR